jgi:hypothetical protein
VITKEKSIGIDWNISDFLRMYLMGNMIGSVTLQTKCSAFVGVSDTANKDINILIKVKIIKKVI